MVEMVAFDHFIEEHNASLRRIAMATRGEFALSDVVNEAWLVAAELLSKGEMGEFSSPEFCRKLLAHLGAHCIHHREKKIRNAIRFEQAMDESVESSKVCAILNMLSVDEGKGPEEYWLMEEDCAVREDLLQRDGSLAGAYVQLIRHFKHMRVVANHLLVSLPHAYRCCAKARRDARLQSSLTLTVAERGLPRPWRRFRLFRPPVQLEFDFDDRLL